MRQLFQIQKRIVSKIKFCSILTFFLFLGGLPGLFFLGGDTSGAGVAATLVAGTAGGKYMRGIWGKLCPDLLTQKKYGNLSCSNQILRNLPEFNPLTLILVLFTLLKEVFSFWKLCLLI